MVLGIVEEKERKKLRGIVEVMGATLYEENNSTNLSKISHFVIEDDYNYLANQQIVNVRMQKILIKSSFKMVMIW